MWKIVKGNVGEKSSCAGNYTAYFTSYNLSKKIKLKLNISQKQKSVCMVGGMFLNHLQVDI